MQISIILIAGLIFLFSFNFTQNDGEVNLLLTITTTLTFTFLPGIIAYFWGIAATRHLSDEMEDRIRQVYLAKRVFSSFEIIILAAFIAEIYYFNLPLLIDQWLGFLTFNYSRRLLAMLPLMIGMLLVRLSHYELDKRARLTGWTRRGFLSFNVKMTLLPVIPLFIYLSFIDLIEHSPIQIRTFFISHSYLSLLILVIFILLAYIKAPMILRFIWPAKPLRDQELYDKIDQLAHNHGITYKHLLVWQTGGAKIANAGVSGLLPGSRSIFMTDYLLENFSHDEIETIVAHEFGHIKYRHIHVYLMFSLAYFLCYLLFYIHIGPFLEKFVGNGPIAGATITISFFYLYFVLLFRYFSRKFERQADLYAVAITGKPVVFQEALWRLSEVNYIPRAIKRLSEMLHTHPSINRRLEFINRMIAGDRKAVRYKKPLVEAKLILFATPILFVLLIFGGADMFLPPADVHYEIGRQYYNEALKEEENNAKLPSPASPLPKGVRELSSPKKRSAKLDKAFQEFQKVIELDAEHEDAHYALGAVYMELGDLKKAVEEFKRVLEINPDNTNAQKTLKIIEAQVE
ncbi:tetratricopeptide repeat protein [Candidatus Poribacteria bacterium]|nr:tetratricopeptide repeat protein [Candidatus Poribacteria bacterium]